MKTKLTIIGLVAGLSTAAFANRPYGTAGCGLGSVFFGKSTQVLAATTNGTSYSQMFGITSGTSNCVSSKGHASNLPAFVESNRVTLEKEVARGEGSTLASLSSVVGCEDSALLSAELQKNYGTIFGAGDAASVSESIKGIIRSSESLSASCSNVI